VRVLGIFLSVLLVGAGCTPSYPSVPGDAQIVCGVDGDCPPGLKCHPRISQCVNPDNEPCLGEIDGAACGLAAGAGICLGEICELTVCGDGRLDAPAETCDDGNVADGDDCPSTCEIAFCGDGFLNAGVEVCDTALGVVEGRCRADCLKIELCGDALLDADEACDDGNDNPFDGCDACRVVSWDAALLLGDRLQSAGPDEVRFNSEGFSLAPNGDVYLADTEGHRVLRWVRDLDVVIPVAGTGEPGVAGDGDLAVAAQLRNPHDVVVTGQGDLFIAEDAGIRRVRAETGVIDRIVGDGIGVNENYDNQVNIAQASAMPTLVDVDGDGRPIYYDSVLRVVRVIDEDSGFVRLVAGADPLFVTTDEDGVLGQQTLLRDVVDMLVDPDGTITLADRGVGRLRQLGVGINIETVPGFDGVDLTTVRTLTRLATGDLVVALDNGEVWQQGPTQLDVVVPDLTRLFGARDGALFALGDGGLVLFDDQGARLAGVADAQPQPVHRLGLINAITSAAFDPDGRLWVGTTELIYGSSGDQLTPLVGSPRQVFVEGARANEIPVRPNAIAFDDEGALYFAEEKNFITPGFVRRVAPSGAVTTVAGGGATDQDLAIATEVLLEHPRNLTFHDGDLYFVTTPPPTDPAGSKVRRLNLQHGFIETIFAPGRTIHDIAVSDEGVYAALNQKVVFVRDGLEPLHVAGSESFVIDPPDEGTATKIQFGQLTSLALDDDGDLYVGTLGRGIYRIRGGIASRVTAKSSTVHKGDGGPARLAEHRSPSELVIRDGQLLIVDNARIRIVDLTTGRIDSFAGDLFRGEGPRAFARPVAATAVVPFEGRLVLADSGLGSLRVLDDVELRTVHGYPDRPLDAFIGGEGVYQRSLYAPTSFAVVDDELWVAERDGHTLRVVSPGMTTAETRVGALPLFHCIVHSSDSDECSITSPGLLDGVGTDARLTEPSALAFDAATRTLFFAEVGTHCVRAVNVDTLATRHIAGVAFLRGFSTETGAIDELLLDAPDGIAFRPDPQGGAGHLYVSDTGNHRVRRLDLELGVFETVIGTGDPSSRGDGVPARALPVHAPTGLHVDGHGNLFITSSDAVREVSAGEDGVARGDDEVFTPYGLQPRFPDVATRCLSDVSANLDDSGLFVVDRCAGLVLELRPR
jgi:cysteine-rich repeat protein